MNSVPPTGEAREVSGGTGSNIGGGETGSALFGVGSIIVPRLILRLDCSSLFLWTFLCTNSNSCLAREHLKSNFYSHKFN